MKQLELINEYVRNNSKAEDVLKSMKNGKIPGVKATDIQENFGILRNNASSILNGLFKDNQIVKINTRPVKFLSIETIHYLNKQYSLPEQKIYTLKELQKYLLEDTSQQKDAFSELCGWNGSLKYQVELAKSAISYPPKGLHTLILGDSGVGKSAFAKAMHEYGKDYYDRDYPLVTFNCADYGSNPQLLLSQLFGHVKNAFTGADKDKVGLVEKADGGILFLDEVHRLPPEGQEMLFYLMDKGEYNRLGDTTYRKSNVLVIAATTSAPDKVLLKTFTRRIPIIIKLPSYKERPVLEKIMIIEKFLYNEALNINKTLYVEPVIFKALTEAVYSEGNVGQLISDIKLLCARAYYAYIQGEDVIKLDKKLLVENFNEKYQEEINNKNIFWYNIKNLFPKEIVFLPHQIKQVLTQISNEVFYVAIIQHLEKITKNEIEKSPLKKLFQREINLYFKLSNRYFLEQNINISSIIRSCSLEALSFSIQFLNFIKKKMNVNLKQEIYLILTLAIWLTDMEKSKYDDFDGIDKIKNREIFQHKVMQNLEEEYALSKVWWKNICKCKQIKYNDFVPALTAFWLSITII